MPPLKVFLLKLGAGARVNKPEWRGYRAGKKFDDIFSLLHAVHERFRRTDRHRPTAATVFTHSVAQ